MSRKSTTALSKAIQKAEASTKRKTKASVKLTNELVNGYKPEKIGRRIFDKKQTGLCLYIGKVPARKKNKDGTDESDQDYKIQTDKVIKSWSILYTDRKGKRQTYRIGTTKTHNVSEARAEATKLLGKIAAGNDPAENKRADLAHKHAAESRKLITYLDGDYFDHYLRNRKSGVDTQKRIKSAFIPFLERDMDTITSQQLVSHRTQRLAGGVLPQSLNRERAALHALFEKAVKSELIKSNPASKYHFEPLEAIKSNRVRYLGVRDEHRPIPVCYAIVC